MRDASRAREGDGALEAHGRSARARTALLERRASRPCSDDPVEAALTVAAAVDLRRRGDDALRMARIRGADPDVDVVDAMLEHLSVAIDRFTATVGREAARSGVHRAVAPGRVPERAATRTAREALLG